MVVSVPHGESDVNVTVVLSLLDVLLVTTAKTPTVPPGVVLVGLTLIDMPISEDCALTGTGTTTNARQASAKMLLTK
jgi:hypothetical protein